MRQRGYQGQQVVNRCENSRNCEVDHRTAIAPDPLEQPDRDRKRADTLERQ
jgi:hypothetical protein